MNTPTTHPSEELLNSWKEIAAYMNRGVRTVQRWESELGLPVRRPRGRERSAVVAVKSELDTWVKACPLNSEEKPLQPDEARGLRVEIVSALRSSILKSRELRKGSDRARTELGTTVTTLIKTVLSMQPLELGEMFPQQPGLGAYKTKIG